MDVIEDKVNVKIYAQKVGPPPLHIQEGRAGGGNKLRREEEEEEGVVDTARGGGGCRQ